MQGKRTFEFLTGDNTPISGKRQLIISRSTFASSGHYVQHTLGQNHREWSNMTASISAIMNFNMFGIPVTGPETCGYFGQKEDLSSEICARWIQLASFYPFAR
jgi:alpha-glucosidase (family GH31 glycosyl hydrolase)